MQGIIRVLEVLSNVTLLPASINEIWYYICKESLKHDDIVSIRCDNCKCKTLGIFNMNTEGNQNSVFYVPHSKSIYSFGVFSWVCYWSDHKSVLCSSSWWDVRGTIFILHFKDKAASSESVEFSAHTETNTKVSLYT